MGLSRGERGNLLRFAACAPALAGLLFLSACTKGEARDETPAALAEAVSGKPCPDNGERLPITGMCTSRASGYLKYTAGGEPAKPKGCDWVMQETAMAGGAVLLYRALQCKGDATKLVWAAQHGDTEPARLTYETSALGNSKGRVAVEIAASQDSAPGAGMLALVRSEIRDPLQATRCVTRRADVAGWPADAQLVDVWPGTPSGGACGQYGFDRKTPAFWREFQHHSWFFRLSPGRQDIDPGSFTLVAWGEDGGGWGQVR
ncbi:hypothetical protein SZ64_10085 [Erythrobacter sp. SG61-1L]|uniref:hypothetical protein n=1 Tax=Erythrobacter sp. SG61-1L TaxID=1603897 RepID=UPI0006C91A4C|nr:hypothetical protein [Erythrobacter sp. SG61-1L]KPL68433.1 hypothetical protein SZ64_10085 [Erythrobacter sp. SG61-1L]